MMNVDEESSDSNAEDSAYSGDDGIVIEENFGNGSQPWGRSSDYQRPVLLGEKGVGLFRYREAPLDFDASEACCVMKVLEPEEVAREMNLIIEDVAGIVHLPPTICRLLLHHYNWSKENLLEKFYESSNLDAFFAKANIISPLNKDNVVASGKESVGPCVICCNQAHLTSLSCGHGFCYRCWDMYLTTKVIDEGSVYVACPQMGCSIVVGDEKALALIEKESVRKRYRRLTIKSFVECNRLLRWCPGTDCGRVVKVTHSEARLVKCKCGTEFCFACVREWHEPVNCRLLQLWLKKCKDDSETSNWISANTKECPRCRVRIVLFGDNGSDALFLVHRKL
uniref:RBR-type E3 ubiquitin transferase n=1 Tax=Parascaris univalens TaxID=6257 RepID=A0A915A003_PARUN